MRTHFSMLALSLLLTFFSAYTSAANPLENTANSKRPNIVLILADDIAWNDYGFAGHPHVQTPQLDRLASESLVCSRGYVPTSLCRPSLMSLITGLYPHQHLVTGNDPPNRSEREAMLQHVDRLPTVPKILGQHGYLSFQSGKWWEGNFARGGFTHGMTHGDTKRGGRHGDEGLKIGREGVQPVLDFIDASGTQPFFVWYAPMMPHTPHNPPQRLLAKYRPLTPSLHVARYWAMIEWFDETCGAILKHLEEKKLADNTLVIYVADNGWIQDPERPTFHPRSKRSRFEAGLRTQVMLRWPGKIAPRRDSETLISSIDLAPTMLAAAGITPTQQLPGLNLLPFAQGKGNIVREALYGALFDHDIPDITAAPPGLEHRWCSDGTWKLIVPAAGEEIELFRLDNDPGEQQNLAASEPQQAARLRTLLDAWWTGK
jgi:uncharacterized sulfatase